MSPPGCAGVEGEALPPQPARPNANMSAQHDKNAYQGFPHGPHPSQTLANRCFHFTCGRLGADLRTEPTAARVEERRHGARGREEPRPSSHDRRPRTAPKDLIIVGRGNWVWTNNLRIMRTESHGIKHATFKRASRLTKPWEHVGGPSLWAGADGHAGQRSESLLVSSRLRSNGNSQPMFRGSYAAILVA